jgi:hypothetical protein
MARKLLALCGALLLASCGSGMIGDEDDGVDLDRSQLSTDLILKFVNSADATAAVLHDAVKLDSRAATGIAAHVRGADGALGTADDNPFDTLAELDAIPYVGTTALSKLDAFAVAKYGAQPKPPTQSVTVESVTFTPAEIAVVLDLVNNHQNDLLGLGIDYRGLNGFNAGRPFSTIQAIAAVPYIGTAALNALRQWADAHPTTPPPGPVTPSGCVATGGTYEGVAFTLDEECHAVDFLNDARFSEMAALPAAARLTAYEAGPEGVYDFGASRWATVAQFANVHGIGSTAVAALKSAAATWKANGLTYDTVASTWTNRATLVNGPIYLDKVYVVNVLTAMVDGVDWCAQVRDAPGATNYLYVCVPEIVSGDLEAWPQGAGAYVSIHGTLRTGTLSGAGGYRLNANARPSGPNPKIP